MKYIKTLFLAGVFTLTLSALNAQSPPHPNGGNAPGGGNTPVGGGAPIDGGLSILLAASALYGTQKFCTRNK